VSLEEAVRKVRNLDGLLGLLRDDLGWPLESRAAPDEVTFDWSASELRVSEAAARRLKGGVVRQVRDFTTNQPWGIFLVEFTNGQVYRTALRQVLRGLVPNRLRAPHLPAWDHENILFICTTHEFDRFTFGHFRGEKFPRAKLATFSWGTGDRYVRTLCEYNLPALKYPEDGGASPKSWLESWGKAFDKEPLTREFFRRFDSALDAVKADLETYQHLSSAEAYSHAQLLLERLLFLYFLQNRGWLNQQRNFLLANFHPFRDQTEQFTYYQQFVEKLFWTLASAPGAGARLNGIPFLNGGLFDDDEFAPTVVRLKQNPPLKIRNAAFGFVFDELLERFNFTVCEDTPLDQDVAVDPEMLGKVFESIVLHAEAADPDAVAPDKRKATGSYYTPRIVVHFICKEVLRQYLLPRLHGEKWPARLSALLNMDASLGLAEEDISALRTLVTPGEGMKLKELLYDIKCCDPAVGSGAFPVGLLHELVNLLRIVETAANGYVDPVRKEGTQWTHLVKARIVERSLYGVDIQQQAIEICRLRLWLSLVVDYDPGVDPFTADHVQFQTAIDRISQLPNLDMNFRRGDSLHDHISGIPVRIEPGIAGSFQTGFEAIRKLGAQLHHAVKSERKRNLRVEILRRRLDIADRILSNELGKLKDHDGKLAAVLFEETESDAEKRRQLAQEMIHVKEALAKVQSDRRSLEKLATRVFDSGFYPKLRQLEGADFNSPFNFSWHLDFADVFAPRRAEPIATFDGRFAFVNEVRPQKMLLQPRTEAGGFDIVVGNPPFVTARNPEKRELWRERWPRVCHGKYLLVCPFFDLSFGLLRHGGQLGFIVSNAFAKREFGKPLVEKFFPTVDLQKVIDCSGLMFPGHGTPTCLVFGRNQMPDPESPVRVAAILPGGGDLRTPPEESPLWHTLAEFHDQPGYADASVVVADRPRDSMAKWPWSLESSAESTQDRFAEASSSRLRKSLGEDIGFMFVMGRNEIFTHSADAARRQSFSLDYLLALTPGEEVRNWEIRGHEYGLFPYDRSTIDLVKFKAADPEKRFFKRFERELSTRPTFSGTFALDGRAIYQYHQIPVARALLPRSIAFCEIATHCHFVFSPTQQLFPQTAPVIKLPAAASDDAHHLLVALLNSSAALFWLKQVCFNKAALFWLKQVCFNKGAGADEERDRFVYAGGKVEQLPVPDALAGSLKGKSSSAAGRLTSLSVACWKRGQRVRALSMKKVLEKEREAYYEWNSGLPGYVPPDKEIANPFETAKQLRKTLSRAIEIRETLRAEMIARQEEMDWLVYECYGLDAEVGEPLPDSELSLAREQRPFSVWAQANGDLDKAVASIPPDWSSQRKALWRKRLELIWDNEHVRRIEQPVYKRRWDEQWKIGNSWQCGQSAYDAEFLDAFSWWLSEKAEWWLEHRKAGGPVSIEDWAAALWDDRRVKAAWPVAAEADQRLEAWKRAGESHESKRQESLYANYAEFVGFFKALVREQSVPDDIPFAVPWEELEKRKIKVPGNVKRIRGKLNVPRERFWTTTEGTFRVARVS
jgi:hypothetical protein